MEIHASARGLRISPLIDRDAAASDVRAAGVLLFVLSAAFLTVTMLAASIAPNYDFGGGAISDLGVIAETAFLFNGLLVSIGILNVAGGYLYYRAHRRVGLLAVYVVAGIGAVGAGVFPLDTGGLHSIFALVAFLFFNVQAVATAAVVTGPMRVVSLVAGALGLIFVAVMIIGDAGNAAIFGPIGHGGAERMIAYPPMAWLMAFGGYLLGAPRDPR